MKRLLLAASLLFVACGSASPPGPATLSGVWSGPLTFKNGNTYTIYVDFGSGASNAMTFQETSGYIKQRSASTSYSASSGAVTVNWLDTVYSCATDTDVGKINATLNSAGTSITGTFDYAGISNDGTVTLSPATGLPAPIKVCAS